MGRWFAQGLPGVRRGARMMRFDVRMISVKARDSTTNMLTSFWGRWRRGVKHGKAVRVARDDEESCPDMESRVAPKFGVDHFCTLIMTSIAAAAGGGGREAGRVTTKESGRRVVRSYY